MWLEQISQNIAAKTSFALATILNGNRAGEKLIVYPDGTTQGDLGSAELNARVCADAQLFLQQELTETRAYDETQVFIETYAPPSRLIIFGGVHTAIPLTHYAKILGFRVTIVDGRSHFVTPKRFPHADELIVEWPDDAVPHLSIDASTFVVILTHDPKFDIPALKALSTTKPRYIGAMGSRETRRQHMQELRAQGVSDEFLKTVYGPVGLDLGGRSPEEMALAIIAEIIAVRYHHGGGHLMHTANE